jgi:NAD(P)-dependent dehydrogenase (short-subunit alcohol dehydrogenase family)
MSHRQQDTDVPVALITGGSGGIGYAIAAVLARKAFAVVITARDMQRLEDAASRLRKNSQGVIEALHSDATDQNSVDHLIASVLERFGRIDLLVNCAASTSSVSGDVAQIEVDAILDDLNTKVCGYLRYTRAVTPAMTSQQAGRIVNIGGLTGRNSDTLSGMRNVAVTHMTKALSDALGPKGVTVNALHPGIVRTPHLDELFEELAHDGQCTIEDVVEDFISRIPLRRVIDAEEIGDVVAFLASPAGASITGESIAIDGGFSRGIYL